MKGQSSIIIAKNVPRMNSESCRCVVVEDKGISNSQVRKNLSEFLGKKYIREGLSDDNYARLERIQKALERESTSAESASS